MKLEQSGTHSTSLGIIVTRLFWAGLIAALVVVSVPKILRKASKHSIYFVGPLHSTDSFLHFDTGEINGSERMLDLFAKVPASQKIIIFVRNDDRRSSFIGTLNAYLAWPHPVQIIDVSQPEWGSKFDSAQSGTIGAFVFCRVPPPVWWPRGERFGDTLEVVSAANLVRR
jgi:hypothetical protein